MAYDLRNLRRAGTLQNKSLTSTSVPGGHPAALTSASVPAFTCRNVPSSESRRRVVMEKRETDAIDGIASPRKPRVSIISMSSTSRIFDVACRSSESTASSRDIPHPSSSTDASLRPPCEITTFIDFAPASSAFSTSSFTTLAGRSTTSPAAILFATAIGSTLTWPSLIRNPG